VATGEPEVLLESGTWVSIDRPEIEALARLIQEAGWRGVAYRNLTGGIVAIHRAVRPPA